MVNFESDTIVQINPKQTVALIYIQRSEELAKAWKDYNILVHKNKNPIEAIGDIKACLMALYMRCRPSLIKSVKEKELKILIEKIKSNNIEELLDASQELEIYLYHKNITKIDSQARYDPTRTEQENAANYL